MSTVRAVLIAGPTASGKSALALAVARRFGRAAIVNADSMQVYRDLAVLTARPSAAEMSGVPHELFGHVDGAEAYSVARWVGDVEAVLDRLARERVMPVIVGGTGLYFKALLEGLSPIPEIDPEIRARLRAEAAATGAADMHRRLAARDPQMATRLVPTDTQRVTRALEVIEATGRSLASWQQQPGRPVIAPEATARFVLSPPRDDLVRRCDTRFDAMLVEGALDEVRVFAARRLSPDLPLMRALGVPPLIAHVRGEIDLATATERSKAETRQFAKRQLTWLRRHMIAWQWFEAQETERNAADMFSNIDFRPE